jgi:hypothetical protein
MVSITRLALLAIAGIVFALFVRRSLEVGIGGAAKEIAEVPGVFGAGLGQIGTGLGQLGTGFSQFLRGVLDPFGLIPMLIKPPDVPRPSTSTVSANRIVVMNAGDVPSGNTGGFNLQQSTAESTPKPRSGGAINPTTRWFVGAVAQ